MLRFLLLFSFIPLLGFSQIPSNMRWWNNRHNWDGVTPWQKYIRTQPGTTGPNALPVPDLRNGKINPQAYLEIAGDAHYSSGDKTQNLYFKVNLPVSKNVSLQIWDVPFEQYKTDTLTRDFRAARGYSGDGTSTGDVYVSTLIQLLQEKNNWLNLTLEVAIKTASGNNLEDVRFTDTPGYYFDLSTGKTFHLNKDKSNALYAYAMLGFYVYQTHRDDYYQNDCILYGGGLDFNLNKFNVKNQVVGYQGYFGEYDKPMVYRGRLEYKLKRITVLGQFQSGNHSYPFNSYRLGVQINLYQL